jgi:hypothetical protein
MLWLYNLPDILITLFFVAITLLAMKLVHGFIHKFFKHLIPEGGHSLGTHIHESIILLTSLVLTFSLIQVLDTNNDLEKLISNEAAQINNLDRLLLRAGDPKAKELRPKLLAYTQSIVDKEWPALIDGHEDLGTRADLVPVSRGVIALDPKTLRETQQYNQMLKLVEDFAQSREERIEYAGAKLPIIYWYVIILAFMTKLFVSSLLERSRLSSWVLAAQMTALSAMMSLVFIFDRPFLGESGIKPGPLKHLIHTMEDRTE